MEETKKQIFLVMDDSGECSSLLETQEQAVEYATAQLSWNESSEMHIYKAVLIGTAYLPEPKVVVDWE